MDAENENNSDRALYELLVPRIRMVREYVSRTMPSRLREELSVDDVLQDVWVAAFRSPPTTLDMNAAAVDRWILKIAQTKLVDALRHRRRLKRGGDRRPLRENNGNGPSVNDLLVQLRAPGLTPSGETHLADATQKLLVAMRCLPERQREAIAMRYQRGLSRDEIAAALGTTAAGVGDLLFAGLKRLRGLLGSASRYFTDSK